MGAKPDWRRAGQPGRKIPSKREQTVLQVGSGYTGPWSDLRGAKKNFFPLGFPLSEHQPEYLVGGRSSSHSLGLYQFLGSLSFPGDVTLRVMQSWRQGPGLMCEQKTSSWCSLRSKRDRSSAVFIFSPLPKFVACGLLHSTG